MDFSHFAALQMVFTANAQPSDATSATYSTNTVPCHNDPSTQVLSPLTSLHEQYGNHEAIAQPHHDTFLPLPPPQRLVIPF